MKWVDMDMVDVDMMNRKLLVNFIYLGSLPRIISRTCLDSLVLLGFFHIYVTVRKEFQFFLIFWCTLMYNVVQFLDSARVSQVPGWIGEADYCVIIHIIKLTACL